MQLTLSVIYLTCDYFWAELDRRRLNALNGSWILLIGLGLTTIWTPKFINLAP